MITNICDIRPGRTLDCRVAEVIGWQGEPLLFSTDIAALWLAIEWLQAQGWNVDLFTRRDGDSACWHCRLTNTNSSATFWADDVAVEMALCRAVLEQVTWPNEPRKHHERRAAATVGRGGQDVAHAP